VWFYVRRSTTAGEVAEWSIAPHSKCGVPKGTGGSNPSLSAICKANGISDAV
jgi:hypothetical protein